MSHFNEQNKRIVDEAIEKHFKPKFKAAPQSKEEVLALKVQKLNTKVLMHIKPIIKAGGATDAKDPQRLGLQDIIYKAFCAGFESFTKEELTAICAMYHTQIAMGIVEASPSSLDKPDLLGGI